MHPNDPVEIRSAKITSRGTVFAAFVAGALGLIGVFGSSLNSWISNVQHPVLTIGIPEGAAYYGLLQPSGKWQTNFVLTTSKTVAPPSKGQIVTAIVHDVKVRPITLDPKLPETDWPKPIHSLEQNDILRIQDVRSHMSNEGIHYWVVVQSTVESFKSNLNVPKDSENQPTRTSDAIPITKTEIAPSKPVAVFNKRRALRDLEAYRIAIYFRAGNKHLEGLASDIRSTLTDFGLDSDAVSTEARDSDFFDAAVKPTGYEIRYEPGYEDAAADALLGILSKAYESEQFQQEVVEAGRSENFISIFLGHTTKSAAKKK